MKNKSKVSVIMPCYNDGKYIKEAIESIEKCDKELYELIIVDDGSKDKKTIEVLNELKEKGYNILRIKHQGQSVARNIGAKFSKYHYLLFLDSDNKINPEYLIEGIRVLDENPEIGVVYGDRQEFGLSVKIVVQNEFDISKIIFGNYIDTCAIIRKKAWENCKGFDKNIDFWEDWEFFINVYWQGWKFYHINKVLFNYRLKNKSVNNKRFIKKNRLRIIDYIYRKHFNLLIKIIEEIVTEYESAKNIHGLKSLSKGKETKNLELDSIKSSLTWKVLEKYQNFMDILIHKNLRLEKKYHNIIIFLRNFFKTNI